MWISQRVMQQLTDLLLDHQKHLKQDQFIFVLVFYEKNF